MKQIQAMPVPSEHQWHVGNESLVDLPFDVEPSEATRVCSYLVPGLPVLHKAWMSVSFLIVSLFFSFSVELYRLHHCGYQN